MNNGIFIVTGPVKSGKTTKLLDYLNKEEGVFGIATPLINEKRMFRDLHTSEVFPMEAEKNEKDVLAVGRYTFSKPAFQKAVSVIESGAAIARILVIDEIGPLELNGEGFHNVLKRILAIRKFDFRLILVIRDSKLQECIRNFEIGKYAILEI